MYQLIGGSFPASIGFFVFDPYMLSADKVRTELIRIDDFASDALPMKLALVLTIRTLIECGFVNDSGNLAMAVISLTFMRLHSYAVNVKDLDWNQRAIYTYWEMSGLG